MPPLNLYARVRFFYVHLAHETAGAARTRRSLRPLIGRDDLEKLGRNVPRECERVFWPHNAGKKRRFRRGSVSNGVLGEVFWRRTEPGSPGRVGLAEHRRMHIRKGQSHDTVL